MPISPDDLAALKTPPPPADVVSDDDRATYQTIPPYVDDQLRALARDPLGWYPVSIPPAMASVLVAHPSLVASLSSAYADVGWRVTKAQGQPDGSFLLALAPPIGRAGDPATP